MSDSLAHHTMNMRCLMFAVFLLPPIGFPYDENKIVLSATLLYVLLKPAHICFVGEFYKFVDWFL